MSATRSSIPSHTKYLIVGQGIAGSMLAWSLMQRGAQSPEDFILVDAGLDKGSSAVSTGLINPVVFKRMTLSWGAELVDAAWKSYEELQQYLSGELVSYPVVHRQELLKPALNEEQMVLLAGLFTGRKIIKIKESESPGGLSGVTIPNSGWIDVGPLLLAFRSVLKARGQLLEMMLDSRHFDKPGIPGASRLLPAHERLILCTGIQYRFGQGYDLADRDLPYYPVKGEVLSLRADWGFTRAISGSASLVPRGKGLYDLGSSYLRDFTDAEPDGESRHWLLQQLQRLGLGSLPELEKRVTGIRAGIRPASRDRLAYLGYLKGGYDGPLVFNGLGTRGIMLAPGLAGLLANHLLTGSELPRELDPRRTLS